MTASSRITFFHTCRRKYFSPAGAENANRLSHPESFDNLRQVMPPDAARPTPRPMGPVAPGCRCVQGACGTANKGNYGCCIISEYAGTHRKRLIPLITRAVGAYSQRIAAGAGSHGAVGRGGSVRGRSLPGSARSQPLGSERLASFLARALVL